MSDPLDANNQEKKEPPKSNGKTLNWGEITLLLGIPASTTLSEVFLDDGAWSKAQFSANAEKEHKDAPAENGSNPAIQTTSLSTIEPAEDKKALSE
jgi:hypothetical protein